MKKEFNWKKLQDNECPKVGCNNLLTENPSSLGRDCADCGFKISDERFTEIINDLYHPKKKPQYDEPDRSQW